MRFHICACDKTNAYLIPFENEANAAVYEGDATLYPACYVSTFAVTVMKLEKYIKYQDRTAFAL